MEQLGPSVLAEPAPGDAAGAGGLGGARPAPLDAWAVEEAANEHAGPVPAGGRRRYLSDHFGLVVDYALATP